MDLNFLTLAEVLEIHRDQLENYGGNPGIRDMGLLESALAMPKAGFGSQFLHTNLYEMAAAYLFHIVQNHPFFDGNKRTGAVAAYVFLALNDQEVNADESEFEKIVMDVAEGKIDKGTLAAFFRIHCS